MMDGPLLRLLGCACGNDSLRDGIYALDGEGYRLDSQASWNGRLLWESFESWRRQAASAAADNRPPVTDLYARESRVRPA